MVEERLAACINILRPVRSIYRWQGAIETADEVAAIFKTTTAQADALIARIAALHSYDVPCIVTWPIDKILGRLCRLGRGQRRLGRGSALCALRPSW